MALAPKYLSVELCTSDYQSAYCKDKDGTDLGYCTHKIYKADGSEITDAANESLAVKTVVDFEPDFDYQLLTGAFYQASGLASDMRMYVVMLPDVSAANGGSYPYVDGGINLKLMPLDNSDFVVPSSPDIYYYDATNHTNKLRLILNHTTGVKHSIQFVLTMNVVI